jgi:hypothetical protein
MTALDAARKVYEEKSCHLLRPRKDAPGEYDVKPAFTGKARGWAYLDLFTASAIVRVSDAVNETNRAKMAALPLAKLARIGYLCLFPDGQLATKPNMEEYVYAGCKDASNR